MLVIIGEMCVMDMYGKGRHGHHGNKSRYVEGSMDKNDLEFLNEEEASAESEYTAIGREYMNKNGIHGVLESLAVDDAKHCMEEEAYPESEQINEEENGSTENESNGAMKETMMNKREEMEQQMMNAMKERTQDTMNENDEMEKENNGAMKERRMENGQTENENPSTMQEIIKNKKEAMKERMRSMREEMKKEP